MLNTVYKTIIVFCIASIAIAQFSCKKVYTKLEDELNNNVENMEDLVVNSNFDWTSATQFTVQVQIVDNTNGKINTEGLLIQLLDQDFNRIKMVKINNEIALIDTRIPVSVTRLYLHIPVTGNIQEVGSLASPQAISMTVFADGTTSTGSRLFSESTADDCSTGCTRTLSGNTTNELVVAVNETVCLTGTHNGAVRFDGAGTLKVCGTLNLSNCNFNGNGLAKLIINENATLNTSNFNLNNDKQEFYNYGTSNISANFSPNSNVYNYGTMNISGDLNINGNAIFENRGPINIAGNMSNNRFFYNYSYTTINGDLNNNGNKNLENYGSLIVKKNFAQNSILVNTGYISVGEEFRGNSGKATFGSLSMMKTKVFVMNSIKFTAEGEGAVVKVTNETRINSGGSINGNFDICTSDGGAFKNNNSFGPNVYYCTSGIYIPASQYNPEGYGVDPKPDADNDGIPDNLDQFPNDPTKAFVISDPYLGYKTSLFEDLWPTRGDYDFNDVVVKNRTNYILSPSFKVVSAEVEYILSAMGGSIPKGLAIQFLTLDASGAQPLYTKYNLSGKIKDIIVLKGNISPSFEEASGNTIKTCDNLFKTQSVQYSNDGLNNTAVPDTFQFNINLNSGLDYNLSLVTDIFIFKTEDRGHEIHVAGRPATNLATTSTFGTFEDRTSPATNNWYKTEKNLPWGIELYTGNLDFKHTSKKNSIIKAYPNFAGWAQSGGKSFTDWFSKPTEEFIFNF